MKYFIAHDVGTSGLKSSLFSEQGELVLSCLEEYEAQIKGREATQNPLLLLYAVLKNSRELSEGAVQLDIRIEDILAMSFSAQMNACLLVDNKGNPLHDTLIWADTRADIEAEELIHTLGFDHIYNITANRAAANYSLYKLIWIKKNRPEIYQKAAKMLQAKDFISFKLTGHMVTDHSDASGTGAYDIREGCWSDEIIEAAKVRKELFPQIQNSIDPVGYLLPQMANKMGLSSKTLVVTGGGDGPSATVGAGCVKDNQFYLTYGTSAWIGGTTSHPVFDKDKALFSFAHIIPGKFMPLGTMQAAGTSYKYLKNLFEDFQLSAKDYDQLAATIAPGSEGLIYLPYLQGERSPIWDAKASAAFLGIRHQHQKAHYARAVLEGIAYNLEWILSYFRQSQDSQNAKSIDELVITGGGAVSPILRQIFADILNVTLLVPQNIQESTSIAAAIMAGIGCGHYQDFSVLDKFFHIQAKTEANQQQVKRYRPYISAFRKAYQNLRSLMSEIEPLR